VPSVDLGDLDGDGDLDMVVSSFGGGFWRWFRNDGSGTFTLEDEIDAPNSPSCAVLYDGDNDGDLDMALFDELADYVLLMQNGVAPPSPCSPAPTACREVSEAKKSKLLLKDKGGAGDLLVWNWTKGEATTKPEFGDPIATDSYTLCIYEDDELKQAYDLRQACGTEPCWKDRPDGFSYHDAERSPHGLLKAKLQAGSQGSAKVKIKGKGDNLPLPVFSQPIGVIEVQLQQSGSNVCWGATFTPPFKKNDATFLKALSEDPASSTAPPPIWSAIHAQVIGPTCGGCHGGSGGLSGLADCNTGHANLVDVPSTELASMDRVQPGAPGSSWLMHKLDGTQDWFDPMCGGMFCGSQMPLGGELPVDVRDAIRAWITNGAVNDCP
jgi:hypothetical protein